MSLHQGVDLQHWIAQFPLERLRAEARDFVLKRREELPEEYPTAARVLDHIKLMEPHGEILVGPGTLAVNEQLRTEAFAGGRYSGSRRATDVFVWARGEAPHRAMTKIGGLPYRPQSVPWPLDDQDKPMRFVAQICFADSRDIVGDLPGDVLLIFGDDDALTADPTRLILEWSDLETEDLVSEIPPLAAEPLTPCYSVIYRTEDWPDAGEEIERYCDPWLLRNFEGTKIGGVPSYIQGEPIDPIPIVRGRFLTALGSISFVSTLPLTNQSEPCSDDNYLMIGDMGSLYLFFDDYSGGVIAETQFY